jgi:hypothetical protein
MYFKITETTELGSYSNNKEIAKIIYRYELYREDFPIRIGLTVGQLAKLCCDRNFIHDTDVVELSDFGIKTGIEARTFLSKYLGEE